MSNRKIKCRIVLGCQLAVITLFCWLAMLLSAMAVPTTFISSWTVRYYNGSYDNVNPAPTVMAFMPFPGWDYVPTSTANLNSYKYQFNNGRPVAAFFLEQTAPVGDNTNLNGAYARSNSVKDTVTYFTTNTSPAGMPLNDILSDFEPYDQTQARCDLETTNLVNLVRASANTNVSAAYIGNYAEYPGTTDVGLGLSRSARDTFYRNSGLNVAQPNAYPYASYTNNGPNARAAVLWSDVELVSLAKLNLPAGHKLLPWLTGGPASGSLVATLPQDSVALMQHVRLRGADGFCDLGGLLNQTYAWTDLDWLFGAVGQTNAIQNLTTSKATGVQWSGAIVATAAGTNMAFMFSNLSSNAASINLPSLPGLPTVTPAVPAGTHTAWYFINNPGAIATNLIGLGRDGVNHGLYLSGNITVTNAILVADPGTNPVPTVTIGSYFTNPFSPTLAGPLTLSNNVILQGNAQNLNVAGAISGSGGITSLGNVTLSGTNSNAGLLTVSSGLLLVNGITGTNAVTVATSASLGGTGDVRGAMTVQAGGAIQAGNATGAGTLTVVTLNLGDTVSAVTSSSFKVSSGGKISTSALTVSGTNIVNLLDATLTTGTNTLITYAGSIGGRGLAGFQLGTTPAGMVARLQTNNSAVQLVVAPLVAPVLAGHSSLGAGGFSLSFSGQLGQSYQVLASTNLFLPVTNWIVLTNGIFGSNVVNYTDSVPVQVRQFYRIGSP